MISFVIALSLARRHLYPKIRHGTPVAKETNTIRHNKQPKQSSSMPKHRELQAVSWWLLASLGGPNVLCRRFQACSTFPFTKLTNGERLNFTLADQSRDVIGLSDPTRGRRAILNVNYIIVFQISLVTSSGLSEHHAIELQRNQGGFRYSCFELIICPSFCSCFSTRLIKHLEKIMTSSKTHFHTTEDTAKAEICERQV